jgi:exopolyphosphatase/guanosine-5'-triphosphate,3'-diphosphate pyrophosphatase
MPEIKPRYEFRIWGDSLSSLRDKLQALAQASSKSSDETYLISAATDRSNVKVRADLMDIKVLVAVDRGLEQWRPILKAGFPLGSDVIAGQVFPGLELTPPSLAKASYNYDEFIAEVIRPNPKIAIVAVHKTRYQYTIGVCATEYSNITINGTPRDTVAVESTNAVAVLKLVAELGINEANVSYIREIRRILGWQSA